MRSSAVLCSIALLLTLSAVRAQTDAAATTNTTADPTITSAPPAGGFPSPGQNSTNSPTDSVDTNSALNSTLRELAISRNVHFGFGVTGAEAANKTFAENASAHATMIGFQNETTLSVLQPTKGTYDFSGFDNVVKFAKANEIKVRAGPIFSSASMPAWVCNATAPNGRCKKSAISKGALWIALKDHLESVVKHLIDLNGGVNGTTVYSLDVVSGALATNIWKKNDKGRLVNPFVPVNVEGYDVRLNRDIFYRSFGQKYVASMFKWARKAAPAKWRLFISEKGFDLLNEQQGRSFFIWLQNLISNGVPIDGVNLQFTQPLKHTFHRRAFRQLVTKLIDRLNIEVHVTELQADPTGVDVAPGEYIEAEGGVYAKIAQSCLSIKGCRAVLFPSYADRASDPYTRALFTAEFAPRTAVGAVFNAIQSVKPQPQSEDVPASSQELPDAGPDVTAAAQESTTEAPAAETASDSSKRGYWWTAEAPLDPLVPTPCSSDKECCAGAKCKPSKTGKFCFLPNDKPCPRCKFGFHYKHGVCYPDSNPCAADPCASTEANPRTETVCLYEPKQCITQPCPQFKCVAPKPHPCPFNAQYDRKFGICTTKEVRRIDSRECKQCVFCSQIIPRCYPPCRNDEYCEITPQTCADCAAARCVPRPIKRFIFEVEQFMPEVPDTLENDPAYYNCVLCPQVPSRCPVCAENEHCEMSPQTCGHCAHMKCVGNTPAASC